MKVYTLLCLTLLLFQNECPSEKKSPSQPHPVPRLQTGSHPTHRFVLAQPLKDVAFDTQTGQLCRTWDWQAGGYETSPDKNGLVPERKVGQFAPTCLSIYQQSPTQGQSPDADEWPSDTTGVDNATGRRVLSHDGGKTWQWADQ
jgi:hypothetical protein